MILGAGLLAALLVFSCSKQNNQKKPDDKEQPGGDEPGGDEPGGETEFSMEVAIDGDFAEWDTLTGDTADGAYYICEENGNTNFNGVLRLKLTSDADYIYVYTELLFENIFVTDAEGVGLGSSGTGFQPTHPGTPGGLMIYVDVDNNASTGYASRICAIDGESMWSYTGFDAMPQYYFCWDSVNGRMQLGWQQNNAPEYEDGEPLSDHGAGWVSDTPDHDFDVSTATDVAFSGVVKLKDPASGKQVDAIQMEIAMDRQGFLKCYGIDTKAKDQTVIGIFYEQVGDVNVQTDATGAGKLPSSKTAATLKLK